MISFVPVIFRNPRIFCTFDLVILVSQDVLKKNSMFNSQNYKTLCVIIMNNSNATAKRHWYHGVTVKALRSFCIQWAFSWQDIASPHGTHSAQLYCKLSRNSFNYFLILCRILYESLTLREKYKSESKEYRKFFLSKDVFLISSRHTACETNSSHILR